MGNNVGQLQEMRQEQAEALNKLDSKIEAEQASGNYNVALMCVALLVIAGMSSQVMKVMGVSDFTDVSNQIGTNVYQVVSSLQYFEQNASSITAGGTTSTDFWSNPTTEQNVSNLAVAVSNIFYDDQNLHISKDDCGVNIGGTTYYIYTNPPTQTDPNVSVTMSTTAPTGGASDLDLMLSMSLASYVHSNNITSVSSTSSLIQNVENGPIVRTLLDLGTAINGLGGQVTYNLPNDLPGSDDGVVTTGVLGLLMSMGHLAYGNSSSSLKSSISYVSSYDALTGQNFIPGNIPSYSPETNGTDGPASGTSSGGNLDSSAQDYLNDLDPSSSSYGQTSAFTALVTAGQNTQKGVSSTSNQEITVAKTAAQLIETLDNAAQAMEKSNQQLLTNMIRNFSN